jgi:hypothetical protein
VILKAIVHRFQRLPKRYMVRIVSANVPVMVVMHDRRNILWRNLCEVGYTRYRMIEMWGRNSETMSNAPVGILYEQLTSRSRDFG